MYEELGSALQEEKSPYLIANSDFSFELFKRSIDVAIAQSLFTHTPPEEINKCLNNLKKVLKKNGVFYATFFESKRVQRRRMKAAHDHASFFYTRAEMEQFAISNGFTFEYIGDWGHPRKQVIIAYRLKPI